MRNQLGMLVAMCALSSCADATYRKTVQQTVVGVQPHGALQLVSAHGVVEVRRGRVWQALAVGETAEDVAEIKSAGTALLELSGRGPEVGRLWLKAGSTVSVGDAGGALVVSVGAGAARLSLFDDHRAEVATVDGVVPLSGEDVLLQTTARGVVMSRVAEHPERVDWTIALIESASHPRGLGTLETRSAAGEVSRLSLERLSVQAQLAGDLVETRVEEVFVNPTDQVLEGTFRFPLPDHAELIGLAMEINGRLVEGALTERSQAQRVYDEIVDKMQDPAILEWEQGNQFKLRVYPIEAKGSKRIVIRYLAPLQRAGDGWQYVYSTAAPDLQTKIPAFRLELDGKVVSDVKDFVPGRDVVVELPASPHAVLRETRPDGTYLAVRVQPKWKELAPAPIAPSAGRLVVIVDTSRSALEGRALAVDSVRSVLGELRPSDRFALLGCDLGCRAFSAEFVSAARSDEAVKWLSAIDFDGASDLGAMFATAGKLGGTQVLYLGDGIATWGETAPEALRTLGATVFASTPFHALVLGKGAGTQLLADIAGATGGRVAHPTELLEARRFALFLAHAPSLPRLRGVKLAEISGLSMYPAKITTLFEGDELVALVRSESGKLPASLRLEGKLGDRDVSQDIALEQAADAPHVAQRWARGRIDELEAQSGNHGPEIIQTSLDYGVMSHKTAFLVLESEEMWTQYQLRRKAAAETKRRRDPSVSGGDLESVDGEARLSPDHIQPGDPEIRVPAPADAQQVEVIFPFGETKLATYEPALRAWTVRFLIDNTTPDGSYQVLVRITLADGQVQLLQLPYVVDTVAPTLRVTVQPGAGPRSWDIDAVQTDGLTDARLVEVGTPDGDLVTLRAIEPGRFHGTWKPDHAVRGDLTLRVVVGDRAQNQRSSEMVVRFAR